MFEKLSQIEKTHEELTQRLTDPSVLSDRKAYAETNKALSEISKTVELYREYVRLQKQQKENEELLASLPKDDDLYEMSDPEPIKTMVKPSGIGAAVAEPPVVHAVPTPLSAAMVDRAHPSPTAKKKKGRDPNDPPAIFFILKIGLGLILLLLGVGLAGLAIYALTASDAPSGRPFKMLGGGLFLMVVGGGLLKSGLKKD